MLTDHQQTRREDRAKVIRSITTHYPRAQKESVWDDYDRRLSFIPTAELADIIDTVLQIHDGMAAPKPAAFIACYMRGREAAADATQKAGMDRYGANPFPGGLTPTGERWMTAGEARARLVKMGQSVPEAFEPMPKRDRGEKQADYVSRTLPLAVERMMVVAYQTVIRRWERSGEAPEPLAQDEMRFDSGSEFVEPVL